MRFRSSSSSLVDYAANESADDLEGGAGVAGVAKKEYFSTVPFLQESMSIIPTVISLTTPLLLVPLQGSMLVFTLIFFNYYTLLAVMCSILIFGESYRLCSPFWKLAPCVASIAMQIVCVIEMRGIEIGNQHLALTAVQLGCLAPALLVPLYLNLENMDRQKEKTLKQASPRSNPQLYPYLLYMWSVAFGGANCFCYLFCQVAYVEVFEKELVHRAWWLDFLILRIFSICLWFIQLAVQWLGEQADTYSESKQHFSCQAMFYSRMYYYAFYFNIFAKIRSYHVVLFSEVFTLIWEITKTTVQLSSAWMDNLVKIRRPLGLRCDDVYVQMSRKNIGRGICFDALAKLIVTVAFVLFSLIIRVHNRLDKKCTCCSTHPCSLPPYFISPPFPPAPFRSNYYPHLSSMEQSQFVAILIFAVFSAVTHLFKWAILNYIFDRRTGASLVNKVVCGIPQLGKINSIDINAAGKEVWRSAKYRETISFMAAHILSDVYFALLDKKRLA
jgi:hypothetical protein